MGIPVDITKRVTATCDPGNLIQLKWSPRVFLRRNVLSESQVNEILEYARSKIDVRAPLESPLTKSTAVHIEAEPEVLQELSRKLSEWVMIPDTHAEPFLLRRFRPGHSFDAHHDFLSEEDTAGQRVVTVVFFLQAAVEGGQFEFPHADLSITPQQGDAILYHSRLPNAQKDLLSTHRELPSIEGEKWTLTKYYRER